MALTVKNIQQIANRYLWCVFVGSHLLISVLLLVAIYQHQNNFHDVLETLSEKELSSFVNSPTLATVNNARLLAKNNNYRQLPITTNPLYLSFQQPVTLLLTSPLYLFSTLFLLITFIMIKRKILPLYTKRLLAFDTLDGRGNSVMAKAGTSGTVQPISDKEPYEIIDVIDKNQQQLLEGSTSDISSVQSIRASTLLDQETDIGNRAFFDNRLQAFLKNEDAQGAVLLIQFKELELVQALYGYQQAMLLLSTMIQVTKQRLESQSSYFIARRGDDELSVILPGVFIHEVEKLTERLLKNLKAVVIPTDVNQEEFIHIGISYFRYGQTPYQIMSEADMALRSAQLQGPSQWFMFEAGELEEVKAKGSLKWRTFLTAAIAGNSFVIFFQPVMACNGTKVLHQETLSKVRDKNGTLISARVFLPMAKKCGLTVQIDLLILDQVCRVLAYEKKQHGDCSVNISIDSFLSNGFSSSFLAILSRFPSIKGRLIIEISEYQLVNHLAELASVIHDLHTANVKIIADKVGQYVVSADYLNLYPIYAIKLHRSIVLDIDKKIENQVFIQSLKALAAPKKIPIYALGVEQQTEWRTLMKLGIQGGQGHLFTEPVAQVAKAIHQH